MAAILTAVATSGIVFSYNGFQSPVNLAGEARDPGRSVPLAIFGSIVLSAIIYVLLQIAFVAAVPPAQLLSGWSTLQYSSPFAQLALALNLNWLALLLYGDAFISPSGTGTTYNRDHRPHALCHGAQRNRAARLRTAASALGHSARSHVVQSRRGIRFSVLLSRMGHARGGDLGRNHHHLSRRPGQCAGPAPYGARAASAVAHPGPCAAGAAGVRGGDTDALLGALALHRQDRAAAPAASAGLRVLPGTYGLAPAASPSARRHLAARLPRNHRGASWGGSREFDGHGFLPYGWDQLCVALAALLFCAWGVRSGWSTPALAQAQADQRQAQQAAAAAAASRTAR